MRTFALLLVVFIDVMGQGLLFPIVNALLMDPAQGFLPPGASAAERQFDYGLLIGVFFLAWFLGAAYIAKLSDYVGRRAGILICLAGTLAGYLLTILALYQESFPLLLLGRAISGFTAGNQPIAQAALVDVSRNDAEKTRYMGLIVAAFSLGLVAGPVLGGLLTDPDVLGDLASLELPFYVVIVLVLTNAVLILVLLQEPGFVRRRFPFQPFEIFLTLWRATQRPTVRKLAIAFFLMQLGVNSFYIFMDNYLFSRFQFGIPGTSLAMMLFGGVLALVSGFLLPALNRRFRKADAILGCLLLMAVANLLFIAAPSSPLVYLPLIPMALGFAIAYPSTLALFSAAVDEKEQGWVMGVTVALFTLGAGVISLLGGELMALDIYLPFYVATAALLAAAAVVATLWRQADVRALEPPRAATP